MVDCSGYAGWVGIGAGNSSVHNRQQHGKLETGRNIIRAKLAVAVADDNILVGKIHNAVVEPVIRGHIMENDVLFFAFLRHELPNHFGGCRHERIILIITGSREILYAADIRIPKRGFPGIPNLFAAFWRGGYIVDVSVTRLKG